MYLIKNKLSGKFYKGLGTNNSDTYFTDSISGAKKFTTRNKAEEAVTHLCHYFGYEEDNFIISQDFCTFCEMVIESKRKDQPVNLVDWNTSDSLSVEYSRLNPEGDRVRITTTDGSGWKFNYPITFCPVCGKEINKIVEE